MNDNNDITKPALYENLSFEDNMKIVKSVHEMFECVKSENCRLAAQHLLQAVARAQQVIRRVVDVGVLVEDLTNKTIWDLE